MDAKASLQLATGADQAGQLTRPRSIQTLDLADTPPPPKVRKYAIESASAVQIVVGPLDGLAFVTPSGATEDQVRRPRWL